VKLQRTDQRQN